MAKYHGSCHCGAVQFNVECELEGAAACNCSMCKRAGTLLVFVPESAFELTQGAEMLTDYQFHKMHIHHTFCKVCGIKAFASGRDPKNGKTFAVNARCLDGVDTATLKIQHFDGASL